VRHVTFVKIDAEGFDLQVLEGAEQLLLRQRPALMVETWGPPTVRDWLEKRGYKIYRYAFETRSLCEYPRPFLKEANVIAVHEDQLQMVRHRLISATPPSLRLPKVDWSASLRSSAGSTQ
jgi:hypothetical protein